MQLKRIVGLTLVPKFDESEFFYVGRKSVGKQYQLVQLDLE